MTSCRSLKDSESVRLHRSLRVSSEYDRTLPGCALLLERQLVNNSTSYTGYVDLQLSTRESVGSIELITGESETRYDCNPLGDMAKNRS